MSERTGSVRDARFLSGADLGRIVFLRDGARGVLHQIGHSHAAVTIRLGLTTYTLEPHDAVTITGADR